MIKTGPAWITKSPEEQTKVVMHEYFGHVLAGASDGTKGDPLKTVYLKKGASKKEFDKFHQRLGQEKTQRNADTWAIFGNEASHAVQFIDGIKSGNKAVYISPADKIWNR